MRSAELLIGTKTIAALRSSVSRLKIVRSAVTRAIRRDSGWSRRRSSARRAAVLGLEPKPFGVGLDQQDLKVADAERAECGERRRCLRSLELDPAATMRERRRASYPATRVIVRFFKRRISAV
jgi:hypothetical protein